MSGTVLGAQNMGLRNQEIVPACMELEICSKDYWAEGGALEWHKEWSIKSRLFKRGGILNGILRFSWNKMRKIGLLGN